MRASDAVNLFRRKQVGRENLNRRDVVGSCLNEKYSVYSREPMCVQGKEIGSSKEQSRLFFFFFRKMDCLRPAKISQLGHGG